MAGHVRPATQVLVAMKILCGLLICVGLCLGAWLAWFYVHASVGGSALLSQARTRIAAGHHERPGGGAHRAIACTPPQGAVAELVIPSISLVAPVVEGDGIAQLSDAIGHVPTSVWPGGSGTTVLVAHDVTWFHDLNHLAPGSEIEYESGCSAYTYRVQSTRVVAKGSAVASAPGHLALVTCWPLNALWFTGQRFLVQATVVGGARTAAPVEAPSMPSVPPLAVPASLAPVDTLGNNPTPLGALTVEGTPATTFDESPGPLSDAAAVQSVFFAAQRAAESPTGTQWAALAPGTPEAHAAPLAEATVTGFGVSLATTLVVTGEHLTGGRVRVQEELSTGGTWTITCTEGLVDGKLAVTGWSMSQS